MLRSRLEDRVGPVRDHGLAELAGYKFSFNVRSSSGTGKANVVRSDASKVIGVLYDLSLEQLQKLDGEEKHYDRIQVGGILDGKSVMFEIYVGKPEKIGPSLKPKQHYLDYIVKGAQEHGFPHGYVTFLTSLP